MPTTRTPFGVRTLVSTTPDPVAAPADVLTLEPAGPDMRPAIPGTIGVVTGELLRYATFWRSTQALLRPASTEFVLSSGLDLPTNRNRLVEMMQGDWLFCLDDDVVVQPTTLLRLLATMEAGNWDVVAAFSLRRVPPFDSLVYLADPTTSVCAPWVPDGRRGVMAIAACGMGGVLVHKRVFDALEPPYFRVGQIAPDQYHEDVEFCFRVRAKGFRIAVDLDTPIGHVTPMAVWPARDPAGNACAALAGHGGQVVSVDTAQLRESMFVHPPLVGL